MVPAPIFMTKNEDVDAMLVGPENKPVVYVTVKPPPKSRGAIV